MLGKKIRLIRKLRGFTMLQLAEKIGFNPSYISLIEKGDRKNLSLSALNKIASALNVPASILLDNEIKPEEIPRMLATGKYTDEELDEGKYDTNRVKPVAIFGQACPTDGLLKDVVGYDCLPLSKIDTSGLFELELEDDSLIEKGLKQGDFVIARYQANVDNGDIAVISCNGQLLVRRVFHIDGKLVLVAFNKDIPPEKINRWDENVYIIGKVIGAKTFF